jgi:hypothetical protein
VGGIEDLEEQKPAHLRGVIMDWLGAEAPEVFSPDPDATVRIHSDREVPPRLYTGESAHRHPEIRLESGCSGD